MDGPDNDTELSDRIFRVVASLALLLGVGSGSYTLSSTDDRIRKAEVELQLKIRDERLSGVIQRLNLLQQTVNRIDTSGPTIGNREFDKSIREHEKRIDELEKKLK